MAYRHLKFPEHSLFLVTGAAGFIGSNLCEAILDMGYRVRTLKEYNVNVTVYDPWTNPAIAKHEYGIDVINDLPNQKFDAAIAAVAHREFAGMDVTSLLNEKHVIFDVKCTLDRSIIDARL